MEVGERTSELGLEAVVRMVADSSRGPIADRETHRRQPALVVEEVVALLEIQTAGCPLGGPPGNPKGIGGGIFSLGVGGLPGGPRGGRGGGLSELWSDESLSPGSGGGAAARGGAGPGL